MLLGKYNRNEMIKKGLEYVKKFNYSYITQSLISEIEKKTV